MKIPIVLAQQGIDLPPAPRASGEGFAASAEALQVVGGTLQRTGHTLAHASNEIAAIEIQKQHEQARDEALDLYTGAASETEKIREQARLAQSGQNPYGVPVGEVPSKTYVQRVGTAYDELAKATIQRAPTQTTQQYLNRSLLRLKAEAMTQAQRDSWGMFKDEQLAGVPMKLESFRSLIIGNPEFKDVLEGERDTYLDSLSNLMPSRAIAELKVRERDKTMTGLVQRAIDANPFPDILPKFQGDLSPESYQSLVHYQETRQRMTLSAINQMNAQMEKQGERMRQETLTDFTALVDQTKRQGGDLTALQRQLDVLRQRRDIRTPSEYEHFSKLITESKDVPSDPDTWSRVVQGIWREDPIIGPAEIRRLMDDHRQGRPGLSVTHGQQALAQLDAVRRRQTSESDSDESRWHARAGEQYRAWRDAGMAQLGIPTGIYASMSPEKEALRAKFITEYDSKVDYIVGRQRGQPAYDVLTDILPRYMTTRSQATVLNYAQTLSSLDTSLIGEPPDPKTPQWLQWANQAAAKIEALRTTNPNLYLQHKTQLLNMNRARTEIIQQMIRGNQPAAGARTGAPGAGAGGYKPPASHLQRPKE